MIYGTNVFNSNDKKNEYSNYINNHKANVKKAWETHHNYFKKNNYDVDKISKNIDEHDISKYRDEEFFAYRLKFHPSEEEKKNRTPEDDIEFNKAWLHHINNNPHHWNYWVFYDTNKDNPVIIDMDDIYIVEMLMDWIAMGYPKNEPDCMGWYNEHKDIILMSDNTRNKIDKILNDLFGGNENE